MVVLATEAPGLGLTRGQLRSSAVAHPFHDVYLIGPQPSSILDRARAFEPLLRPGDAFSHTTAALLWGGQVPRSVATDPRVHVITEKGAPSDRFRRAGVCGHRGSALPIVLAHGLPVVAPAATWLQMASVLTRADLIALGDRWVTPQGAGHPALTGVGDLQAALDANPGRRGAARARQALALVRVGPRSRMETRLRLLLVDAGWPEPVIAPAMSIGGRVMHPDLAYPQWRLVLEYEGDGHRSDPLQWRRDIWRREAFESAGQRVVRVHRDDIRAEPDAFLERLHGIVRVRSLEFAKGH